MALSTIKMLILSGTHFPVVMFVILYDEILKCERSAISCGTVIMVCKAVPAFESADKNLKYNHSNESY